MTSDPSNPQITIGVVMNAQTGPGAAQAVADIERVKASEGTATASTQRVVAATEEEVAVQSRARQVMQAYGVSIFEAGQALALLGADSKNAAIGSAELDAAVESAVRSTVEASAQRAAYNVRLRESTELMLAEVAAMDAHASAEERQLGLTEAVQAAMKRMGVTEGEVALASREMNASFEGTARAMVQIKQAELAAEVTRIRTEMEGVTIAAGDNVTGIAAVGEQLAQAGTQRHVLTSIREMARGGAYQIRGEAEATFLLGRALNSLLPGVGVIIAVASGVGLVAQILEEHSEKAEAAADKVKESAKEMSDGAETSSQQLKQTTKDIEAHYDAISAAAGRAEAAVAALVKTEREHQRIMDERNDAELAAKLAQLDQDEGDAEKGKSPEEKAEIARQFDVQRLNLRQKDKQDKANQEAQAKRDELAGAQQDLAAKTTEQATKNAEIQQENSDLAAAGMNLKLGGVRSDADLAQDRLAALQAKQRTPGGLDTQEQLSMEDLQRRVPLLVASEAQNGPSWKDAIDAPQIEDQDAPGTDKKLAGSGGLNARLKEQKDLEEKALGLEAVDPTAASRADDARAAAEQIQKQISEIIDYQGKGAALTANTKTNAASQEKTNEEIVALKAKITDLEVVVNNIQPLKVTTVALTGYVAKEKQEDKDAEARAKEAFQVRDDDRYARKKTFETQAEDQAATPDQRAAAKAQVDKIDAEGLADLLASAVAMGLSRHEQSRAHADMGADQTKAVDVVAGQNKKDAAAAEKVESKTLAQQIAEERAQIEASGNSQIKSQARQLVASAGKSRDDQTLLLQELIELMSQMATGPINDIRGLKKDVRDLRTIVERNSHT